MALYDKATDTKHCDRCDTTFKGQSIYENFFKLQSTKDGLARVCKKCYYKKADPKPEATVKAQGSAAVAKTTSVAKAYSHSDADIKAAEASSGLKFLRWMDMGDHFAPLFGKVET